MSRLIRSAALSLTALAMAAAGLAAPVSADPAPDYGAVVKCVYHVTQTVNGQWSMALLKRINVKPPTVPAMTTAASVGWRFVVERSMDGNDNLPYSVTYRSPIQRAASSAEFTPMRVNVTVPAEDQTPRGRRNVYYHVTLKMFWYGTDGSLVTRSSYLMPNMHWIIDSQDWDTENYCPGLDTLEIDGH